MLLRPTSRTKQHCAHCITTKKKATLEGTRSSFLCYQFALHLYFSFFGFGFWFSRHPSPLPQAIIVSSISQADCLLFRATVSAYRKLFCITTLRPFAVLHHFRYPANWRDTNSRLSCTTRSDHRSICPHSHVDVYFPFFFFCFVMQLCGRSSNNVKKRK